MILKSHAFSPPVLYFDTPGTLREALFPRTRLADRKVFKSATSSKLLMPGPDHGSRDPSAAFTAFSRPLRHEPGTFPAVSLLHSAVFTLLFITFVVVIQKKLNHTDLKMFKYISSTIPFIFLLIFGCGGKRCNNLKLQQTRAEVGEKVRERDRRG